DLTNIVDEEAMPFVDKAWLAVWVKNFQNMNLKSDKTVVIESLERFIPELLKSFHVIPAAGGYVLNDENQLLMIQRRGVWDLPKGKIEEGESPEMAAVREVEEECGVDQLKITSSPFKTYHLYEENEEIIVKESIWFKMKTGFFGKLIPQEDEYIEQA